MLKEQAKLFGLLNRLVDYLLLVASIILSIVIEQIYHTRPIGIIDDKSFHPIMIPVILVFWHFLFSKYDKEFLYRRTPYQTFLLNQLMVTLIGFSFLISITFLSKVELFYRSTIIAFSGFTTYPPAFLAARTTDY